MKIIKIVLNVLFAVLVVFLAYTLYLTIKEPIEFEKESKIRKDATVDRLKDIRTSQVAYKAVNKSYTADFDSLIAFIVNDQLPLYKQIGDPNDSTVVARVDTLYVGALDSLFKGDAQRVNDMRKIPFMENKEFQLKAGEIEKNEVKLWAFEASALYDDMYNGLIKKYYSQKAGTEIRVGSMDDGSLSGNWGEK